MTRFLPRSLTSRLVVTAVALVAIVGILVATSATLVMRRNLTDRLDGQVQDAFRRAAGPRFQVGFDGPGTASGRQAPGTVVGAVLTDGRVVGGILKDDPGAATPLAKATIRSLAALPHEARPRSAQVRGHDYRILVR